MSEQNAVSRTDFLVIGSGLAGLAFALKAAIELAGQYDRKILVERGIIGREFECSVLGNDEPIAAVPCEILPSREFYDYEDKYELNLARTELPANLAPQEMTEMKLLTINSRP